MSISWGPTILGVFRLVTCRSWRSVGQSRPHENKQWTFTTNKMNTFGTWIFFFHILGIIIPTDFHSFGWYVWSTSFKTRKPMPGLSPSQWFRLVTSIFYDGKIHMLVKSWFNCLNLVGGLIISVNHYWEIWGNTHENCEIYHNTMEKLGNTWLVVWNHGFLNDFPFSWE